MQTPPISPATIDARIHPHIDELLALWWAEQGASKPNDLALIASAIPFPRDQPIRVLDLCCGPGDVGRAIRKIYPNAHIDGIDRDPFFMSICRAVNQREGIPGKLVVRDLEDDGWLDELAGDYDVVATVNALHWFDEGRAGQLVEDVYGRLRERRGIPARGTRFRGSAVRGRIRSVEGEAAAAVFAGELGTVLVEGECDSRV